MSGINSISQAPGFDQQRYDSLIQQARTEKVDTGLVDSLLLNAVKGGKSFDQALAMVGSDLPKLPPPASPDTAQITKWVGIPSPGALIISATTEFAAEQRRMNQELMWQETEAIAESMKNQATEMRSAAVTQLVLGCVSGAVQIGVGIGSAAGGIIGLGRATTSANAASKAASEACGGAGAAATAKGNEAFGTAMHTAMLKTNMLTGAAGQVGQGTAGMLGAGAQYVGTEMQARMKEMEADQEKMRAVRDSVKNLDEGLRDLVRKALQAQAELQASTNQARTKILA